MDLLALEPVTVFGYMMVLGTLWEGIMVSWEVSMIAESRMAQTMLLGNILREGL